MTSVLLSSTAPQGSVPSSTVEARQQGTQASQVLRGRILGRTRRRQSVLDIADENKTSDDLLDSRPQNRPRVQEDAGERYISPI